MARTKSGRKGTPTNLYLSEIARTEGPKIALKHHNGASLSELVEKLIAKEIRRVARNTKRRLIATMRHA